MIKAAARAAVLAVLLLAPATAAPQGGGEDARRAAALAELRTEIATLEERLRGVATRASTLEDRLRRTELELELQQARLAEATAARDLAARRAASAETRVAELALAADGVRDDLRRRLGGLYRLGRHGYLRLFLSLESEAGLLPAVRQLRFLVRRDRRTLARYRAIRDELEIRRAELAERRRETALWREREVRRHDELAVLRRRQSRLLAQVARERRDLELRQTALVEKERKLASFIQALVGEHSGALTGRSIEEFEGVLDWPLAGRVTAPFGPRRDPRYRTEVPHNGVELTVEGATPVRAIYPGHVVFADHFQGYGRMVVVHHPGRIFTLYAGLDSLGVAKGDVISLGAVLGMASAKLYFEIRRENQPEDPRAWLR